LGDAISHQVFDYYQVNDQASNQIILLNILYARDGAPLHFSELSQIRGQISATASASTTFPYSAINHATMIPRNLATIGANISTSPSFDIASLDTKDFTAGVMTPITPEAVRFFLNEGIDYRLVMMLLVSGIRPAGSAEMLLNAPNDSRLVCDETPKVFGTNQQLANYRIILADEPCANTPFYEFFAFLNVVNYIKRLYPVAVEPMSRPVGPPFSLSMSNNLKAVTSIDPAKYKLTRLPSGQYQLMTAPRGSMIVLCEANGNSSRVVSVLSDQDATSMQIREDACQARRSSDDDGTGRASSPVKMVTIGVTPGTFVLELRSTLEVIRYVGQVLAFQENATETNPTWPERCITLQFIKYDASNQTCGGAVLIHLLHSAPAVIPSDVSIMYHGERLSLAAPHACPDPEHCDLSQETMSIIALLLNRNKSAKDLTSTPAVEVVP
jgi:hypothetical protein